jgi:hypothetical protein
VSGYGPAGAHVGANFTLAAFTGGCAPAMLAALYLSPELTEYSFDACNTCYCGLGVGKERCGRGDRIYGAWEGDVKGLILFLVCFYPMQSYLLSPPSSAAPLVTISLPPGSFSLPAFGPDPLSFGFIFQNNDRNIQASAMG